MRQIARFVRIASAAAMQLQLTVSMRNTAACTKQARPASAAGGLERSQTAPQQPIQPVSALDGDERHVTSSSTASANGSSSSSSGKQQPQQQQQQQLGGASDILRSASAGPVLGSAKNSATAEEGQEAAVHSLWEGAMQVHTVVYRFFKSTVSNMPILSD
jgi:hypothetical protein